MKILGVIVEVGDRLLTVSLPNGLKGTVARAEASDVFPSTGAKKADAAEDSQSDEDSEEEEEEEEAGEELSLRSMFEVGQVVRCAVRGLGKGKSGGSGRVELSLRLSAVCAGLGADTLVDGAAVPACVESVEDHGLVLSFGIAGAPRGFLPRKSVGGDVRALHRGSLVDVVLVGTDGKEGLKAIKVSKKNGRTAGVLTATVGPTTSCRITHVAPPPPHSPHSPHSPHHLIYHVYRIYRLHPIHRVHGVHHITSPHHLITSSPHHLINLSRHNLIQSFTSLI